MMYCKRIPIQAEIGFMAGSNRRMPLWVKVQGPFVILLVLVVIGMFSGVLNIGLFLGEGTHGMPAGGH